MKGTEKQIKWAEDIKASIIRGCDSNIKRLESEPYLIDDLHIYQAIRDYYTDFLNRVAQNPESDNAAWWIQNRNLMPEAVKDADGIRGLIHCGYTLREACHKVFGYDNN